VPHSTVPDRADLYSSSAANDPSPSSSLSVYDPSPAPPVSPLILPAALRGQTIREWSFSDISRKPKESTSGPSSGFSRQQ
ncbi:MAG: hypothetical protein Q8P67_10795, partial [archaeon]|nr:hypothetical protein [archaeon]